jgi:preprotein translocase subunit SecB
MPNAPTVFLESENPKVDVQLEVSDAPVLDALHEVVVRVTVTAKVQDKVLFLVEGKQAGIFEIRNVPAEQKPGIIGILCPGIVYPYLRANIADLITRTGLPPINLAEINFEAFYQQRMAAVAQQRAQAAAPAGNGAASA